MPARGIISHNERSDARPIEALSRGKSESPLANRGASTRDWSSTEYHASRAGGAYRQAFPASSNATTGAGKFIRA